MSASHTPSPRNSVSGQPPLAEGPPIGDTTTTEAAQWLTMLMSGEMTESDYQRWRQWRTAHPDHERAWQHIEMTTTQLEELEPDTPYENLSPIVHPTDTDPSGSSGRRKALGALLWLGTATATTLLASRTHTWRQANADYRTGTGEQREIYLADETRILLNTRSAIDVAFDPQRRLIRLITGDILVTTGSAPNQNTDPRPFIVETAEGHIWALGTCFMVSQQQERTRVAVLKNAVEIAPADTSGWQYILPTGQQLSFMRHAPVSAAAPLSESTLAWIHGQIIADNLRLGDFITDLERYRSGLLHCDPAVAELRLSGVFLLEDTDRILATLPGILPVQIRLRTRYWVTVEAVP